MRWLITGAGGMLGRDLTLVLTDPAARGSTTGPAGASARDANAGPAGDSSAGPAGRGLETGPAGVADRGSPAGRGLETGPAGRGLETGPAEVIAATRAELDITDPVAVRAAVAGVDVVLNTAAWTDVDGAEATPEAADAVNGHGVRLLAEAAGPRLIHISTDYVFDGAATTPYPEEAPRAPLNAYGRSKALGEEAVLEHGGFVVRTAWLYGEHGPNFVRTMLRLAAARDTLDVVADQQGPPTWSLALAHQLVALAEAAVAGRAAPGAYHGTAAGSTTWHGLARAVFSEAGLDPARVRPTTSDRFPRPARRPSYSVLSHARWPATGVAPLPHWRSMLEEAMPALLAAQR